MAESADKAAESAEKAYADAAEAKPVAPAPLTEAAVAKSEPAPAAEAPVEKPVAAAPAPKKAATESKNAPGKPVRRKAPAKKTAARSVAVKVKAPAKTRARAAPAKSSKPTHAPATKVSPASAAPAKPVPSITQLKEKIMATAKTPDFTKPFADAVGDMQTKAKAAYEKSTAYAGEMTDFAKGNVEAFVESGKILSNGMQDVSKTMVDEAKSAYETATADMKEMASVKSPTELFQLQGKLARRNFESMVALSSKTGDMMMKLYTEAFAPISSRVSLAADKLSKAA